MNNYWKRRFYQARRQNYRPHRGKSRPIPNKDPNPIIARMIQPIRIAGIISLFTYFLPPNMIWWDPSVSFFYTFILLYVSSFAIELVLTSSKRFRDNVPSVGLKFMQMLPVEFAGVAGLALLTFAPHTVHTLGLAIQVSVMVAICWVGIELYHRFIVPRLNKIKLTPQMTTLAVVGMTITVFFEGFYFLVLSPYHLVII